jgi:hypothetical protein
MAAERGSECWLNSRELRLDVLNVGDTVYQIRNGTFRLAPPDTTISQILCTAGLP